jgi:transposase-like protein
MDLIPRGERRHWTTEQKQTIAAQSLAPGASPTDVARLHGISTGQLYMWRQALKAAQAGVAIGRFARVEVAPQPLAPADIPAIRPPSIPNRVKTGVAARLRSDVRFQPPGRRKSFAPWGAQYKVIAYGWRWGALDVGEQALMRGLGTA